MSLCSKPLTPECEKEVQRLTALIPEADLSAFAATEPGFLHGGFRLENGALVRARLLQIACGAQPVSDALRRLIAKRSRVRTLTGLLAPSVLFENRHAFAALLGDAVLLVALLLDDRPEVRAQAESWMGLPAPFLAVPPEEAQRTLHEAFAGISELLGVQAGASAGAPLTRESWQAQKEKQDLRILDLQEKNRRLKGVDDRLSQTALKLSACEEKLSAAQSQLAAAEKALRQTTRERDELKTELERETSRREERLTAALDVALAREFFGWIGEARAAESAAARAESTEDLLARADAALKRQGDADRHSGNRSALEARLARTEDALERVRNALANAIRPLQDLKSVEKELEAEIRSLRSLLKRDEGATPLETALTARIHAAADNELPKFRDLPDLMASLGVLTDEALARVRLALQRRIAAAQAAGVPPDPRTEARRDAVSKLGQALAGHAPAILLLDGHNVLFGLPVRYNPPRGGAVSDAEKREKLASDVVRLTAASPNVRAWIVFDGPTRSDTQASANVRITYSGGSGEHRADGVILDNLRFFNSQAPETPVFLVSNDGELCTAARRLGAQTIPVLDFGAFL